jgi:AcrR family transcriptional regulator
MARSPSPKQRASRSMASTDKPPKTGGAGQAKGGAPARADEAGGKKNRTWSRRAEARPDEILDAALDEFVAKGFDAARMDDVAARAGLSKGAIYLYFAGKDALLRALIEREVSPVFQSAAMIAANTPDPKAALRAVATMVAGRIANPRLAAIPLLVVSISNRFPELADFYRVHVVEKAIGVIETLIGRGVAMGQFKPVDPRAVVRAMAGPIMFEVIWAHALKGESRLVDPAKWLEAQFTLLFEGLEASP